MPELPEVQTVVDSLRSALAGRRIIAAHILRTDVIRPAGFDLAGAVTDRRPTAIRRRGKRIVLTLEGGQSFYFHLGMTGRLTVAPAVAPVAPHTHLILDLDGGGQLRFVDPRRFGGVFWLGAADAGADIGPEPLTLGARQLARRLARTKRAIKSALLDQTVVAGLGNIYVDESLFAARVNPLRPAARLTAPEIARLSRAIKQTLRTAIRHRGSTLRDYVDGNGAPGGFQRLHRVYQRDGQACPSCGRTIRRVVVGGRSTHFCPTCQRR